MAPFYESVCEDLGWSIDKKWLQEMKDQNETDLKKIDDDIEDATKNLGETEVRDLMLKKAEYYSRIGDKVPYGIFEFSFLREKYVFTVTMNNVPQNFSMRLLFVRKLKIMVW